MYTRGVGRGGRSHPLERTPPQLIFKIGNSLSLSHTHTHTLSLCLPPSPSLPILPLLSSPIIFLLYPAPHTQWYTRILHRQIKNLTKVSHYTVPCGCFTQSVLNYCNNINLSHECACVGFLAWCSLAQRELFKIMASINNPKNSQLVPHPIMLKLPWLCGIPKEHY